MNTTRGNNEHDRHFGTSDEVLAEILHPPATTADQRERMKARIAEAIQTFLDLDGDEENEEIPSERHWKKRVTPDVNNIVIFSFRGQPEGSQTYSLVPLKLKDHPKDDPTPDDVLRLLKDALTDLIDRYGMPEGVPGTEPDRPSLWPIDLDGRGEIFLKSIAPNSVGRALHHGKATGGPGSLPVSNPVPTVARRKFTLSGDKALTLSNLSNHREPGARLVALDTAPSLKDFPDHVKEIFTADPAVEIFPFPQPDELSKLLIYTPLPHHYDMCDHGTFLCSVMRFITKSAKIWLYEVLNCFGTGSFLTVAQGLAFVLDQVGHDGIPTKVNCSFTLAHDADPESPWNIPFDLDWGKLLHYWHDMQMRNAFHSATSNPKVTVVASAGNDAVLGEPRPPARYPAAYDDVVKVAALPKGHPRKIDADQKSRYIAATYSNLAYLDPAAEDRSHSFAIFGGDVVNGSSSPTGGVLGVYAGIIPTQNEDGTISQDGERNRTGIALWSGTSMAAAILAAILVALDDELVFTNPFIQKPDETLQKESVVRTRQGS